MKTNYTTQPEKAYEKPGEWTTNVYTTASYEMPAQNAIIETVMSIENQELVFAEGNNGNASAESVAVATMSTGRKKVVVVNGTTQVCTLDEDNNTVAGVTVSNYSGPLRTGDIDLTVDGTIDAAALASLGVSISEGASAPVNVVVKFDDNNIAKGSFPANDLNGKHIVVTADSGLSADNVIFENLTRGTKVTPLSVTSTEVDFGWLTFEGIYKLTIAGEVWAGCVLPE